MSSVSTSGSILIQDSDGEQTLATISVAGDYVLALDLNDVADGETVIARIKGKVRDASGDTVRLMYEFSFVHAQAIPNVLSVPIPIPHTQGHTFHLETDGASADITIPWAIYLL